MDESKNMHNYSLECINVPLDVYLQAFRNLNETVCFRIIADKPDKAFSGHNVDCVLEDFFLETFDELTDHNKRGRGIFKTVNKGGHSDADITEVKAQFVEMDDIPLEEQLRRVQEFPLEPSIIVKTRKSLHVYWLMKNAKVSRFRHIQKQLVAHFGGDPACVNESRVMRVPNFEHHKQEPLMVGCIKFNPELRYTQEQLAEHLPEIEGEPEPTAVLVQKNKTAEFGTQCGLYHVGCRCEFLKFTFRNAMARNYGDRSEAFYRRLIIISFNKLVPEEKKDPQLLDNLRKEADGILWWAIQGLRRLISNNYRFSETDKTRAEVQKYKLQNNNVLAFVLEHCVIEEGAISSRRELYDAYKEFCSDNGKATSKQNFNAWICDADPAKITLAEEAVTRARIFKGIRLM